LYSRVFDIPNSISSTEIEKISGLISQKEKLFCQKIRRKREILFKKISRYSTEYNTNIYLNIRIKKTG